MSMISSISKLNTELLLRCLQEALNASAAAIC